MTTWVAFLRGVNLGRRQMKMAELRDICAALGFGNIKTILASGNVRFDASGKPASIRKKLEHGLKDHFDFEVGVILRTAAEIEAAIAANPFAGSPAASKGHVLFVDPPLNPLPELKGVAGDFELVRIDPDAIYLAVHRKDDGTYLARSAAGGLDRALRGRLATMRTWATVEKTVAP